MPHSTLRCAVVAILALVPALAFAQQYGLGDQVLVIGPSAFLPATSGSSYSFSAGYLHGDNVPLVAPLDLPEGAEILRMCVYGDVPAGGEVWAEIWANKQAPGGTQGGIVQLPGTLVFDSIPIGYGVVCTDPFSFTLRQVTDIDGDGSLDNVVYAVNAQVTGSGFGGVRVFWRRQVSPPPATATFGDVPTTHPFYAYVEALVSAGITAGCGNGNFCPDAPLTRKQMAAFLTAALGLHWVTY